MNPQLNEDGEYTVPYPRPWRGTIRWTAICLLAGLGAWGLRVGWGHWADARWQGEVDRLRAEGQAVTRSDFTRDPIPDDVNGAMLLMRAGNRVVPLTDEQQDWVNRGGLGGAVELSDVAVADEILRANEEPLALLRQARQARQFDWKHNLSGSFFGWQSQYNRFASHSLERVLLLAIAMAIQTENYSQAIELIRDGEALSHLATMSLPGLTPAIMADGLRDNVLLFTEQLAHQVRIGHGSGDASPEQVRALINELLDDGPLDEELQFILQGERVLGAELLEELEPDDLVTKWLFRPSVRFSSLRLMNRLTEAQEKLLSGQNAPPAAIAPVPVRHYQPPAYALTRIDEQLSMIYLVHSPVTRPTLMTRTARRAVAILLAIRLYQADHDGQLPAQLGDLTPDYLPAVPLSTESNQPIEYAPQGLPASGGRPAIYVAAPGHPLPTTQMVVKGSYRTAGAMLWLIANGPAASDD